MNSLGFCLAFILFLPPTFAAIRKGELKIFQPIWNEGISFFKSPESLFPSGQASFEVLNKRVVKRESQIFYMANWNHKEYQIPADSILRDIHLSHFVHVQESTLLYSDSRDSSFVVGEAIKDTKLKIIKSLTHWAQVQKGTQIGWAPLLKLQPLHEDLGIFSTLVDTPLRRSAEQGAPFWKFAEKGTRWIAKKILEDWIEVDFNGQRAFLDLSHLAHRSDLAEWAYHKNKGWLSLSHRMGGILSMTDGKEYLLKDFTAFKTDPKKGLIRESIEEGPRLRSRVQISSLSASQWRQSEIPDHGLVWWKQDPFKKAQPQTPIKSETLLDSQMLKKDLFDLSLNEKNGQEGLASHHGIYRKISAQVWEKIDLFKEQNMPVSIHPDGVWFVGPYRSFDKGNNFEPYIKWDQVTQTIQSQFGRPPLYMKLVKIKSLKYSQIELIFDTGYKKISLFGHVLGHNWITKNF